MTTDREQSMLEPLIRAARAWFIDLVLPLWATNGFDPSRVQFHERLDLHGQPVLDVPYRLVSQARQIYVYATAARLGWYQEGGHLALRGLDSLTDRYRSPDSQRGYVAALMCDGKLANANRHTYDHAFVLLALAACYALTRDDRHLVEAKRVLAFLDDSLLTTDGRGFRSSVIESSGERLQDPQMHYLEAMLCWHEATGLEEFLGRAAVAVELFSEFLWQRNDQFLAEHLDHEWRPVPEARCTYWRPGHHFEWASLLRLFAERSGRKPHDVIPLLYQTAQQAALPDGRIVDEVNLDGTLRTTNTRLWPQCERARATLAGYGSHDPRSAAEAATALRVLGVFQRSDGLWAEHLDQDRRSIVAFVPATSPYHLLGAVMEADRVLGDLTASTALER